jgi:predicted aconitase with swiveling domain
MKMLKVYKGRGISTGSSEGEALVTTESLSFFGSVDPDSGTITEIGHELYRVNISRKVLVMQSTKGSTASTWAMCRLHENRVSPAAIIIGKADTILISGAIIAQIPCVDNFSFDPTEKFRSGQRLRVNANEGTVEVLS